MRDLRDFLLKELQERQMSITKFAREVGVSTQTIANIINEAGDYPRIQTLIAIADYTGVSVTVLFSLTVGVEVTRAQAHLLAQRIIELPVEKQKIIYDLLSGIALNQVNSDV